MNDQPLKHLTRPKPPWAELELTICGRPASDVAALTTPDEVRALVSKHGKQRAAFLVCMTCANRWRSSSEWRTDPAAITAYWLERMTLSYVIGLNHSQWDHHTPTITAEQDQVRRELHALANLVEAHRAEFDALVAGTGAIDLASRRNAPRKTRPTTPGGRL